MDVSQIQKVESNLCSFAQLWKPGIHKVPPSWLTCVTEAAGESTLSSANADGGDEKPNTPLLWSFLHGCKDTCVPFDSCYESSGHIIQSHCIQVIILITLLKLLLPY